MITAALVGVATPPMVQVTLTTDNGQAWSVIGTDGVEVWAVPGGSGIGDGQQVTLADNRKPGNREITYQVTSGSRVEQSQPIVIPFASGLVIQTLSGSVSIEADYAGSRLPLDFQSNQTRFDVPGRPRPVIRYAPTSDMASATVPLQSGAPRGTSTALEPRVDARVEFTGDFYSFDPRAVGREASEQFERILDAYGI